MNIQTQHSHEDTLLFRRYIHKHLRTVFRQAISLSFTHFVRRTPREISQRYRVFNFSHELFNKTELFAEISKLHIISTNNFMQRLENCEFEISRTRENKNWMDLPNSTSIKKNST